MPRRSVTVRVAATLAALTLGASLAACADTTRIPPAPTDTGAAEPLFASDEEALAAAVAAYEEFLAVSDEMLAAPGANEADPESVAGGDALVAIQEAEAEFQAEGIRVVGAREIANFVIQELPRPGNNSFGVFYVCEDVAGTDLVDAGGNSLIDGERESTLTAWEVVLEIGEDGNFARVIERDFWQGAGICP